MAWTLAINKNWTSEQKKNLQRMLNSFGFTDAEGNALSEDGTIGPKTMAAIRKLNRYQSEAKAPSGETRELQKQLNEFGFRDAAGRALREDGIYGPKTDAANSDFENNFLDGVTDGKNATKTVQKEIYPSLPQITQQDVESVITPKSDPMASQKNPDGTWKQIAAPGAWSGSGGSSANEQELLRKALEAQRQTTAQNAGRTQGGYTETGGAQSQAVSSPGANVNTPAPSTGYDFLDRALGKGKYANASGLYNKWNNPFDTLILGPNSLDTHLSNSADMMYNNANNGKSTRSLLEAGALRASGDKAAQANQKNPDGTWKQVAAPGAWSGSGGETEHDEALLEKAKAAQRRTTAAAEITGPPKTGGKYISEEDYNQQSGALSRQLTLNEKATEAYSKILQIYQGNTDPEAVRMYAQAQAGYNRGIEAQSTLQEMMDTLQSNRDYSTRAEEAEKSDKYFDTDVDAASAFAEEAIPLTYRSNNEYAAIMTLEWVPENRNGKLLFVPKYTYSAIMEGEHGNVVDIALAGLLVPTEGKKYLLHTHPKSRWIDEDGKTRYDRPDYFSGAPYRTPYDLFNMGDASIPTLAGADWYEAPNILNNLPVPLYQFIKNIAGLSISGYDGIYLCSPNGKLYYYEGTGEGEYQANTKDELENKIYNNPVADDFPKIHGYKDYDTNTIYAD